MYNEGKCPQKENWPQGCLEKIRKCRYGQWPDCSFECYRADGWQNFAKVFKAMCIAEDIKQGIKND
jgi:hypothetical protein